MALKAVAATGAWSAAATWNSITNTPTLHASTNVTIDGTARFTAGFTAPNTTNACTGVLLYINAVGSGGTVTVTLQESTVDTAAARTINITSLVAASWVYFRFATPYVFTTTGASAYRFKVQTAGAAGTTNAAADSGGSLYCYLATDDRTGVPGSTDDIWIVGQNQATAITVTMDGTQTIGSGTNTTGINRRSITSAIVINNSGILSWDITASATLTCKGTIMLFSGGELRIGTVVSPYPSSFLATLNFDENGTGGNYGLEIYDAGILTLQGTPKTTTALWKTKYTSGSGSTASPLVTLDSVDWAVGDELLISATSNNATNYNETENKFIRVKNSPTSYTLADTAGGAESALTHTHTADAWILNVTRNVLIRSTTSTHGFYLYNNNTTNGSSAVNVAWTRFETVGLGSVTNKVGIILGASTLVQGNFDYSVAYRPLGKGFNMTGTQSQSYTGLIACNQNNGVAVQGGISLLNVSNRTLTDCFVVKGNQIGFELNNANGILMTRCVGISNNTSGNGLSSVTGGVAVTNGAGLTLNSCEVHCNRNQGLSLANISAAVFNAFLAGTKGTNSVDINANASVFKTYCDASFIGSSFGSATFISGYTNMAGGSVLAFQTLSGTANNHLWYTPNGIARSAGASLVDTTTKTAGNLAVRLAPENLTPGFIWEFLIGIRANSAAQIVGFAQKNAAFGSSVCTIELFLPGSTVADATATLDNTTGSWQVFNLAASYTGLEAAFAIIRITAKTTTPAAYVYFTDFYNGTNVLTGLQAWYNGKPSPVLTDLLGDPASVWAILTSTQSTAGTMGKLVVDNLNAPVGAVQTSVDIVAGYIDTEIGTLQTSINNLNNLSDQEVWEYATRTLSAFGFAISISEAQAQAIADQVLRRSVANVQDEAERDNLAQLILATFESSITGTAWTIRKTGGATYQAKTVTLDAAAVPVAGVT